MQNGKQHNNILLNSSSSDCWLSLSEVKSCHFLVSFLTEAQVPVILKACTQHGKHFSQTHQCPSSTWKTLLNTFYLHYVTYFWVKQYIQCEKWRVGLDFIKRDLIGQKQTLHTRIDSGVWKRRVQNITFLRWYIFLNGDNYSV